MTKDPSVRSSSAAARTGTATTGSSSKRSRSSSPRSPKRCASRERIIRARARCSSGSTKWPRGSPSWKAAARSPSPPDTGKSRAPALVRRMRIALAADHAGYLLKDELARWLGAGARRHRPRHQRSRKRRLSAIRRLPRRGRRRPAKPSAGSPFAAPASASRSRSIATRPAVARASTIRCRPSSPASIMTPTCSRLAAA